MMRKKKRTETLQKEVRKFNVVQFSVSCQGSNMMEDKEIEKLFDVKLKWPSMLNSSKKYKDCLKNLDTLEKFSAFMEDTLILNTLHLTDSELWTLIQKISKDVIEINPVTVAPISIQQWVVDYFSNWEAMKIKKQTDSDSSSTNSVSIKSSNPSTSSSFSSSSSNVSSSCVNTDTESSNSEPSLSEASLSDREN